MNELSSLGARLRSERVKRNEPQKVFAARLGVSVPTLKKMEEGAPTVAIGHWFAALSILGREDDLRNILAPQEDLFQEYEKQQQRTPRQRASRKRK